jgi:hypothetical protein
MVMIGVPPLRPSSGDVLYWFEVTSVPEGGAPQEIRAEWVGVPLPVRRPRPVEGPDLKIGRDVQDLNRRKLIADGVVVEIADALSTLRLFGRETAADWWDRWSQSGPRAAALVFRTWEGRLLPSGYVGLLFPELDEFGPLHA